MQHSDRLVALIGQEGFDYHHTSNKKAMNLKITTEKTLAIIMGEGAGTRLFPLTKERAKPAVPLGGKYRLVASRSAIVSIVAFASASEGH